MVAKRRWLGGIATAFAVVVLWLVSNDAAKPMSVSNIRVTRARVPFVSPLVTCVSEPVELGAVEHVDDAAYIAGCRIAVRVVDESHRALAGVLGSLEIGGGSSAVKLEAESMDDGVLHFTVASADNVLQPALFTMSAPGRLTCRESFMLSGDLNFERGLTRGASVRVVDSEGEPIEGAVVKACSFAALLPGTGCSAFKWDDLDVVHNRDAVNDDDLRSWALGPAPRTTGTDGRVVIPFAASDEYFIASVWDAASGARHVSVEERAHGFTMELKTSPICGVVVDDTGRPLANARVGGVGSGVTTTGADGRFVLRYASPDVTSIAAVHVDHVSAKCNIEGDRDNAHVVLDRGMTLHVRFVTADHEPVDLLDRPDLDVVLMFFGRGGRERQIELTTGSECTVHGLSPGPHELSLRYDSLHGGETLCSTMIDVGVGAIDHTLVVP